MNLQTWIIIAGTLIGIYGISTFAHPFWRLMRRLAIAGLAYEIGYFLFQRSHLMGAIFAIVSTLVTPVFYFFRICKIRIAKERRFEGDAKLTGDELEELIMITEDMEAVGFSAYEDFGFPMDGPDGGGVCRVLIEPKSNLRATIFISWQGHIRLRHINLTTIDKSGTKYTTTDYPGPMPSQLNENHLLRKCPKVRSFLALYFEHTDFIEIFNVEPAKFSLDSGVAAELEGEHQDLINYSIQEGFFLPGEGGNVRFSIPTALQMWKEYLKTFLFGY